MPDPTTLAALGGVALAIGLWAVTNLRLSRGVKAIQADIEAKRTATQTFVDERLSRVEGLVGGMEARLRAEIPPSLQGDVQEVREEIETINVGLRKEFEDLPARVATMVRDVANSEAGVRTKEMMSAATQLSAGLQGELNALGAQIPAAEVDLRGKVLRAISREPTKAELKGMGPVGELVWNFGRMKAAEWLQTGPSGNGAVTYTVTPARRAGNMEM